MKTLIVEDEFTSRLLLQEFLAPYGPVHIAVNGNEAVNAVRRAIDADQPYQLICLDIMMPELRGDEALKQIRELEYERGIELAQGAKVFMTSALGGPKQVIQAFNSSCDAYLLKPISASRLQTQLRKFGLSG
jgi:two-component system chemotaxis response regulator CheY